MSNLENISEDVRLRRDDLAEGVGSALTAIPVQINKKDENVLVNFQELLICGMTVEEEGYRIYNASEAWSNKTSYRCEESGDGTWHYYLETIDEVIGEVKRLVMFEATKKSPTQSAQHTSDLSKVVTAPAFEKAYAAFIEQADKNAKSKLAQGSKVPLGFSEKPECDGAHFKAQYGHGAASVAPYMNWWVVSIYYLPTSGNIVMGIEADRYPHLKEMQIKPLRYAQVGNKKVSTAVFYSANKNTVNYSELYNKFIDVCEEVMRLGLK